MGENFIKIIDSHQHFWKLDRGDYGWLTEEQGILYQDYLPKDLEPFMKKHSVSGTILVQAAPTVEETLYLLSLYRQYEWVYGVVGWLDFSSTNFKAQLQSLLNRPGLVGLRPMLQDIDASDWILQNQVIENLKVLAEEQVPLDLLIKERHIPYVISALEKIPDLTAVVDHLAKPKIANGDTELWKKDIKHLASFSNVWCKVSGLMTEAEPHSWKVNDFQPYIHQIINSFGPSRILFGTDWPVCLAAGNYEDVFKIVNKCLPESLSTSEKQQIFYSNAIKFYKLRERSDKCE
ncbi:amidohydrolase family protein [Fredinandcohnia onubensis]|uniref:amidohydrolase family protein n=1 Tax=Fredinandcohnia onubensis TaxID=1571209 RepID=UPI000C0BEEA4|nr:amidohydrolase family protein [Fredinandcohnia onubensis]